MRMKVRSPRGRGEPSFWRVAPDVEGATRRTIRIQLEDARRELQDVLRSTVGDRLHREQIRALRAAMGRANTAL
jgi:hypothetical protein